MYGSPIGIQIKNYDKMNEQVWHPIFKIFKTKIESCHDKLQLCFFPTNI